MALLEGVNLQFKLGDTWVADDIWAIVIDDAAVDLDGDDWTVRAQAKRRSTDQVPVQEWTTDNDRVLLGTANVPVVTYDADGVGTTSHITTSTVQLHHTAHDSAAWDPFSCSLELEIERGTGDNTERHTVVTGRISALRDLARA